ncbi:glycosyltransferase [Tabrizicola sp. J26]|uniref:glycosyltransferase family 2 protein n=1 Tax=Alitabrizicola rongguiensis TaxID=2909234 RepID=UPI001F2972F2|nr:glycosyltransferase [Tabrizicola rongguiensis]MCF1711095.1 glycosyltransferase [Tabrizicola rongguiensis]
MIDRPALGRQDLPRLAVVIPCYNSADWIGRTISSVLDQDYPDLVLIVADDGSTDGSAEVVRGFGERVILQTGPNRGACHARNRGTDIARARGASHILYLDADDWLEGPMLLGAARTAAETGADIVLSDMHLIQYDGRRDERFLYSGRVEPVVFFEDWLRGKYFNPSAILWSLPFVDRIGGWDETLARAQDEDISLRAMFENPLIMKNDHGAAIHARVNPNSVSRSASPKATESRMRVLIQLIHRLPGTPLESQRRLLAIRLYKLTWEAYRLKQFELGRMGKRELIAIGFTGNPGPFWHRAISKLVGLEAKVRLFGR